MLYTLFGIYASTYELGHEGNHQVEKTDSLDESETQNGVREELATESRVAGNTVEEGGEDETDTDTSTGQTNGGRTHTQVLGDLNHGLSDLGRVSTTSLEGLAGGGVDDLRGLLALDCLEGIVYTTETSWLANWGNDLGSAESSMAGHSSGLLTTGTGTKRIRDRRTRLGPEEARRSVLGGVGLYDCRAGYLLRGTWEKGSCEVYTERVYRGMGYPFESFFARSFENSLAVCACTVDWTCNNIWRIYP